MRPAHARAPGPTLEKHPDFWRMAVEELEEGRRVRMKTCIPGLSWTGKILRREGEQYAVKTDRPHFGSDVHLVKPKDLRTLADRA